MQITEWNSIIRYVFVGKFVLYDLVVKLIG